MLPHSCIWKSWIQSTFIPRLKGQKAKTLMKFVHACLQMLYLKTLQSKISFTLLEGNGFMQGLMKCTKWIERTKLGNGSNVPVGEIVGWVLHLVLVVLLSKHIYDLILNKKHCKSLCWAKYMNLLMLLQKTGCISCF